MIKEDSRVKQGKMLDGITNEGKVTGALKATRDRDVWKVMIVYAKKQALN